MATHSQASDWCNSALHAGKLRVVHCPESVPEHDLIASLGSGPEQKGGVLKTHLTELVNGSIDQK